MTTYRPARRAGRLYAAVNRRWLVGACLVLLVALGLPAAGSAARKKRRSCSHGGYSLVLRSGSVRVLERVTRVGNEKSRTIYITCWAPTRRRTVVARTYDTLDARTAADFEIVDKRLVGIRTSWEGGAATGGGGALWDPRTGRKLHDTRACPRDDDDHTGADEIVFLPHSPAHRGGMAFTCNASAYLPGGWSDNRGVVVLYRGRHARTPEYLEDVTGAQVGSLCLTLDRDGVPIALSWNVSLPNNEVQTHSTALD